MDNTDIIRKLKDNNYSFDATEDQIVIRLGRRYFLKLYIENNAVFKYEDMVKQFGLTNGKSLRVATKISIMGYLIFISFFAIWSILDPHFFSNGGKYFFIVITPVILFQLIDFLCYKNRLSKIKKITET